MDDNKTTAATTANDEGRRPSNELTPSTFSSSPSLFSFFFFFLSFYENVQPDDLRAQYLPGNLEERVESKIARAERFAVVAVYLGSYEWPQLRVRDRETKTETERPAERKRKSLRTSRKGSGGLNKLTGPTVEEDGRDQIAKVNEMMTTTMMRMI